MSKSILAAFIRARVATGAALINEAASAYSADALYLATANSSQELAGAVAALPMGKFGVIGKQYKAIGEAIAKGQKAMLAALPNGEGWIGARHGAFSKATKETREEYLSAHAVGVEAFRAELEASGAFPEKVSKTDEEKAKAKTEKAEAEAKKQAEAVNAARKAIMDSGEFIAKSDIVTIDKLATSALIDELMTRKPESFSAESLAMLASLVATLSPVTA
jgi:hypothetical protein